MIFTVDIYGNHELDSHIRVLDVSLLEIVVYLHIEGSLYAQKKCVQLVFGCFWLQNWRVLKFEKSCQFFDTLSSAGNGQIWSKSTYFVKSKFQVAGSNQ